MTPKAQRIAIAKTCGWRYQSKDGGGLYGIVVGKTTVPTNLPNYLSDLNAMHEAEKVLDTGQATMFVKELDEILRREINANGTWEIHCAQDEVTVCYRMFAFVHATAAQRAEAFLRTLNLWDDSK